MVGLGFWRFGFGAGCGFGVGFWVGIAKVFARAFLYVCTKYAQVCINAILHAYPQKREEQRLENIRSKKASQPADQLTSYLASKTINLKELIVQYYSDQPTTRVTMTIPTGLLKTTDDLAKADYMTRSDVVRQALLEYVRKTDSLEKLATPITGQDVVLQRFLDEYRASHPDN